MITDPVTTAGLVAREIRTGERDGAPVRVAVARRTYPTDQADLWDCLTNAERVPAGSCLSAATSSRAASTRPRATPAASSRGVRHRSRSR